MTVGPLESVGGIAALEHPISRAAYQLVVERGWVSRDDAAAVLDVARSVAAFHLDKLVDAGLLETRFERLSGRTGPGAGRPAKLYGRSAREISLSLPPRRYDLAGSVLADAVVAAEAEGLPLRSALRAVARATGARIARTGGGGRRASRARILDVLTQHGYEPQTRGREIALLNCPFHSLAEQHRELVCGMNLDLLTGVLEGTTNATLTARLAPEEGYCCVRLTPT